MHVHLVSDNILSLMISDDRTPPSVNNVLIFSSGISGGKSSVDLSFLTGLDFRFTVVRFSGTGDPEQTGTGEEDISGGLSGLLRLRSI